MAIKLMPYLSSPGHFARGLIERGASGLVLFNRLLDPDIDLARMRMIDRLDLSTPDEMRLPMLWTAMLAGRVNASLAASGGVSDVTDVVKYLLAGADVVMTASALLRYDIEYITELVNGLSRWMAERDIETVAGMRGMMSWWQGRDRGAYTRASYLRILERYPTP